MKNRECEGITFQGIFTRATTTVDGGWNLTFSISQNEADKITELSQYREVALQIACVPLIQEDFNAPS